MERRNGVTRVARDLSVHGGAGNDLLGGGIGDDALNGGTDVDTCDPNNDPVTEGTNTYANCEIVGAGV